jgi:hypothetical protein
MSLNYDLTRIPTEHKAEGMPRAITSALILLTIPVGINAITKENYKEFYLRLAMYERLFGAWLNEEENHGDGDNPPKPRYITLKEVRDRIGLTTNASNMSRGAFKSSVMKRLMYEAEDRLQKAVRELKEEEEGKI